MSRFTGPQFKGASRDARARRREEAAKRQFAYEIAKATGNAGIYRNSAVRPRLGRQLRELAGQRAA